MNGWIAVNERLPKNGQVVETKIRDGDVCRRMLPLKRDGDLWFVEDGEMYFALDTPTHWRPKR